MCPVPQFVNDLMSGCISCRKCETVCPSFKHGGCSPWLAMQAKEGANVTLCIGCGKCSEACTNTNPKRALMYLKADALGLPIPDNFVKHGLVLPAADGSWREGLPDTDDGDEVYVMPGCIVQAKLPYLKYAAARAFNAVGVRSGELPGNTCCMYPIPLRSLGEAERSGYKYRLRGKARGKDIVTLCSGCTIELGLDGINAPNACTYFSKYLEQIRSLPGVNMKVAVQPGCASERYISDFMAIVKATGATVLETDYGCCGKNTKGGVGEKLMQERQAACRGADAVILGCPNCQVMYDAVPDGVPVLHIVELIALAAGDRETQRFHNLKLKV